MFTSATFARSQCAAPEIKILRAQPMADQFGAGAKIFAMECVAVTPLGSHETLVAVYIVDVKGGREVHLAALPSANLNERSTFSAKTESLGLDSFPFQVNGKSHLLAALNNSTIYINPQTGPQATRFSRFDFDPKESAFTADKSHAWLLDVDHPPAVTQLRKRWTAKVNGSTVAL